MLPLIGSVVTWAMTVLAAAGSALRADLSFRSSYVVASQRGVAELSVASAGLQPHLERVLLEVGCGTSGMLSGHLRRDWLVGSLRTAARRRVAFQCAGAVVHSEILATLVLYGLLAALGAPPKPTMQARHLLQFGASAS